MKLIIIFLILFSLQGFSQVTEPSSHPKLDKYYPQKKKVEANNIAPVQTQPMPQAEPMPEIKSETKPLSKIEAIPETKPISEVTTAPEPNPISEKTTTPAAATPSNSVPVRKEIQSQPLPSSPYRSTRLGSSSQLYNTYEKNSNGAGSVTTSPK